MTSILEGLEGFKEGVFCLICLTVAMFLLSISTECFSQ